MKSPTPATTAPKADRTKLVVDVSWATISKIILAGAIVYFFSFTWSFFLLLLFSIWIAMALEPIVIRLCNAGLSQRAALVLISVGIGGCAIGFLFFLVPPVINELSGLSRSVPELRKALVSNMPRIMGLPQAVDQLFYKPVDPEKLFTVFLAAIEVGIGWLSGLALLIVFALYFLSDGGQAYAWIQRHLSTETRGKVEISRKEMRRVVSGYLGGQLFTSLLAAGFTLALLLTLKVPAAFALALLSGIFDVLPFVGFFLCTIPAVILAFTVSSSTGYIVLAAYGAYHIAEAYLIIPRIYGSTMRLSPLVVLLGVIIGGLTGGMVGAIAVLPLLAVFPTIEKVWFPHLLNNFSKKDLRAQKELPPSN